VNIYVFLNLVNSQRILHSVYLVVSLMFSVLHCSNNNNNIALPDPRIRSTCPYIVVFDKISCILVEFPLSFSILC